jgi:hypothetical protein
MIYFRIDRVGAAVALVGVFATYCWAQETVVPVTNAGFHQFTFQDENMSLENVTLPAGYSTGYHSHEQDLGKDPVELEFKLGEVRFAPYTKTPGTHQITNIEPQNPMRLLAVGIVYPTPGRYTVSTRPAKYEVALDNDRARAWRLKLNPGESAPMIRQTAPGARIVVTGGMIVEKRMGKPDQPILLQNHDFMSVVAEERGIENIGNSPVELVEIELK